MAEHFECCWGHFCRGYKVDHLFRDTALINKRLSLDFFFFSNWKGFGQLWFMSNQVLYQNDRKLKFPVLRKSQCTNTNKPCPNCRKKVLGGSIGTEHRIREGCFILIDCSLLALCPSLYPLKPGTPGLSFCHSLKPCWWISAAPSPLCAYKRWKGWTWPRCWGQNYYPWSAVWDEQRSKQRNKRSMFKASGILGKPMCSEPHHTIFN